MKAKIGKLAKLFGLVLALCAVPHETRAITIGGVGYESIATGKLDGYFGMWEKYKMGGTYLVHPTILEVNVTKSTVTGKDLAADGAPAKYVSNFMLANTGYFGSLMSGDIAVTNAAGRSLLELDYVSNGNFSGVLARGAAGEANLVGLYRVTGGSWYDVGTLIYSTLNYSTGYGRARHDFYWTDGTFNLFAAKANEGPGKEVPEPATLALLASSLAAFAKRKRKLRENCFPV